MHFFHHSYLPLLLCLFLTTVKCQNFYYSPTPQHSSSNTASFSIPDQNEPLSLPSPLSIIPFSSASNLTTSEVNSKDIQIVSTSNRNPTNLVTSTANINDKGKDERWLKTGLIVSVLMMIVLFNFWSCEKFVSWLN